MVATIAGRHAAGAPERTGVAVGHRLHHGGWQITAFPPTKSHDTLRSRVASAVVDADGPPLLAIDSPLGWPRLLGAELSEHRAGRPLSHAANELFRRETDRRVRDLLGKQPLDVGADRIARTAVAVLALVDEVSRATGICFDLAWDPSVEAPSMIEVYPASWLIVRRCPAAGYKRPTGGTARARIMAELEESGMRFVNPEVPAACADVLDASITVQLGIEFLSGRCIGPDDQHLAETEGWIWIPTPQHDENRRCRN